MNNNTDIESLAARIKICILNQGSWNCKRQHKSETREENIRHNLDNDCEVYIKLTKHESLAKALTIKGQIYAAHRRLTMPSPCDGMRVVPVGREFEHSNTLSDLNSQFKNHVNNFIDDYDGVVELARKRFNGLFDQSMFPPKEIMKEKFYNNTKYMSAPTQGDWGDWLQETASLSQLELQDRLVKAARHLIDSCAGDGKLYSSVLENLEDICSLAGDFNLLEDPIIAKAAKELLPVARDFSIDVLRDNKSLRAETSKRASEILKVLNLS